MTHFALKIQIIFNTPAVSIFLIFFLYISLMMRGVLYLTVCSSQLACLLACHSFAISFSIRLPSFVTSLPFVCLRLSPVCHSFAYVFHQFAFVCFRLPLACHSFDSDYGFYEVTCLAILPSSTFSTIFMLFDFTCI